MYLAFGAQNLVRDVITGFFIILKINAVGYVTVAGVTGTVDDLRVTRSGIAVGNFI